MSSDVVAGTSAGDSRTRNGRQAATVQRVLDATLHLLRGVPYSELTVRSVAAQAGVAAATAYSYFSSKNALIATAYLHRIQGVPFFTDVNMTTRDRVGAQLRAMALVVADEPELAAATTTAMLGDEAEVHDIRERIGFEVHRRIAASMGPEHTPDALKTLEMVFYGALVHAGVRSATYYQIADHLDNVVSLLMKDAG
jgi:AcrR family transcriptional regulator